MKNACYLKKIGMTQYINENGVVIPVTVCSYIAQEVIREKNLDTDGYESLVVGVEEEKIEKQSKPKSGLFKAFKSKSYKYLYELDLNSSSDVQEQDDVDQNTDVSSPIDFSAFKEGDVVGVRSKSKGKGFQGTIKAHNFSRGPMTHGSKNHRMPGSIGAGTDPARVFKGTRMAKRLGNSRVTIKNLTIVNVDENEQLFFIKGSIPGRKNQILLMYK